MSSEVRPILIGPANALEMTGAPWHYWRRHASEFGLEMITIGSKRFIPAAALVTALLVHRRPSVPEAARRIDVHQGTHDLFLTLSLLERSAGDYKPLVARDAASRQGVAAEGLVEPDWSASVSEAQTIHVASPQGELRCMAPPKVWHMIG